MRRVSQSAPFLTILLKQVSFAQKSQFRTNDSFVQSKEYLIDPKMRDRKDNDSKKKDIKRKTLQKQRLAKKSFCAKFQHCAFL